MARTCGSASTITLSTFSGNQALGTGTGDAQGGAICNEYAWVFPFSGSGVTCTVSQCTLASNTAEGGSNAGIAGGTAPNGGGGGAIEDQPGTNLAVLNCSFTGNQANSGGGNNVSGGAIDNSPAVTVTISDSQFISNSAMGSGLGTEASGGAVDNYQTMTITNCLFVGNSAVGGPMADAVNGHGQGEGGALFTVGGNGVTVILTISNSIVAGNEAIGGSGGSTIGHPFVGAGVGGGIENLDGETLNVVGCTITGNQAVGGASASGTGGVAAGGGITNSGALLNLTNSTVSTNFCQGGPGASGAAGGNAYGSGIDNDGNATAIITDTTISLNQSLGVRRRGGRWRHRCGQRDREREFHAVRFHRHVLLVREQLPDHRECGSRRHSRLQRVGGDGLGGGLYAGSGTVVLDADLVSGNQAQGGIDSQGNTSGQGVGGGVYVDPSGSATMDLQTLIAGNQASKSNNDVWGTLTIGP